MTLLNGQKNLYVINEKKFGRIDSCFEVVHK